MARQRRTPKSDPPSTKPARRKAENQSAATPPQRTIGSKPLPELTNITALLYGKPGVGKTTLAAQFPEPYFLNVGEQGITDLMEYGIVSDTIPTQDIEDYDELVESINSPETRDAQTLVIDSLSGVQKVCYESHCTRHYNGDFSNQGFFSFYSGPAGVARDEWTNFLHELAMYRKMCTHKPNVLLLAHSTIETFKNPAGVDYDEYRPAIDKRLWEVTEQVLPCVLYYDYKYEITADKQGNKGKASKGSTRRILRTEYDPPYNAKNRWNLPNFINMPDDPAQCFDNLSEAILKNKKT